MNETQRRIEARIAAECEALRKASLVGTTGQEAPAGVAVPIRILSGDVEAYQQSGVPKTLRTDDIG